MSVTAFSDVSKAWGLAQVENDDDAQELLLDSPLPTTRPSPTSSIDAAAVTYSTGHMQRPMAGAGEASEPPEAGPHGDAPGLSEDATRASGAGPWNCLRSCSSGLLDVLEPSASDPALQELGMEPEVRETQALSFTMPEMRAMPRAAKAVRPQLAAGDRQVGAGPHDSAASSVSPTGTELLGRRSSSRVFQQPADDDSPGTTARPAQATQDAKGATAAAQSSHPPSELFARSAKADSLPAADAAPDARPLASSRRWLEAALSAVPSSCGAAGERRGRESRGLEGRSSLEKALAALAPSQSARSGGAKPADSWTQLLSMLPGPAFDSAAAPRRRRDGDGAADGEDLSAQVSLDVKGVAALADGMPDPLLLPAARPLADIGMAEASHGSSGSAAAEEPLCTPFSSADGPPAAAAGGRHGAAQSQQELDKMSSSMDLVQRAGDAAPAPKPPLHLQLHSAFRASPPGDTLNRILSEPLLPADDGVSSTGPEPSLSSTLCSPDCQRSASASIGFDDSPGDSAAMSSPGSSCRSRWKKSVRILTKNGLIVPSRARAAAAASLAKRQEQPSAMSVGGGVDVAAPDLRSPPTESSATSSAWHRAAAASVDAKPPASGDLRAQQSRFSLSALADSCRRSSAPKQGGELLAELVGKLSQLQMTPSGAAAGDGAEALSRQQLGSYSSSTSLLAALSPTQSGTTPRIPLAPASGPGGPGSQLACIDSRSHSAGTGANSDGHGESLPNVEGSSGSSGKLDRLLDGQQRLMETVTQLMHRVEALTRKVDHLSAGTSVSNAQILAEPGRPSVSDDILRELKR